APDAHVLNLLHGRVCRILARTVGPQAAASAEQIIGSMPPLLPATIATPSADDLAVSRVPSTRSCAYAGIGAREVQLGYIYYLGANKCPIQKLASWNATAF